MRSPLFLAAFLLSCPALAEGPEAYVPAPAKDIPGYSETVFRCEVKIGWQTNTGNILEVSDDHPDDGHTAAFVSCWDGAPELATLSLRELAILRNTISARYGWAGFRKPWLREHFQKQPWYKPDPKFSSARLSEADRQNIEFIVQAELGRRYVDLDKARDELLALAGKWWGDLPTTYMNGQPVYTCRRYGPANLPLSKDCTYHAKELVDGRNPKDPNNTPVPADPGKLSPEQRIELGLLGRAMGEFAMDDGQREQLASSLDAVLSVTELRRLSLRDLRLLRNTLYARRGRPFKSKLLQKHFDHMPWYKKDSAYTDARLTANDKRNIDLIHAVEQEFGGALKDSDFKLSPSKGTDILDPYMAV